MPLQIQFSQGNESPVVVCDHCGNIVKNATDGNALWLADHTQKPTRIVGNVAFTHKHCNQEFEREHQPSNPKHSWSANELDVFMAYLLNNLKFNDVEAGRRVALLATLG